MADQKYSELPDGGAPQPSDEFAVARTSTSVKLVWSSINTWLNGIYAKVVDLDAHVADTGNPHLVTAVQTGADPAGSAAAVGAALSVHEADIGNPHSVTAAQTGAFRADGDLTEGAPSSEDWILSYSAAGTVHSNTAKQMQAWVGYAYWWVGTQKQVFAEPQAIRTTAGGARWTQDGAVTAGIQLQDRQSNAGSGVAFDLNVSNDSYRINAVDPGVYVPDPDPLNSGGTWPTGFDNPRTCIDIDWITGRVNVPIKLEVGGVDAIYPPQEDLPGATPAILTSGSPEKVLTATSGTITPTGPTAAGAVSVYVAATEAQVASGNIDLSAFTVHGTPPTTRLAYTAALVRRFADNSVHWYWGS